MAAFEGRFRGQTAVISGAGSGIGLAVAKRLTAEGAKVCAWDISRDRLDATSNVFAHRIVVDQADEHAVASATEETVKQFGAIDILIVSAGITGPNVPLSEYPTEAWRQVMDVNLNGVFYINRAVVPHMVSRGYGRIVNLASVAGKEGNPNASAYSASKGGVIALTKSLGKELAQSGVIVNAVAPAAVRTAIFDQMSRDHVDFMLSKIPMGRFGTTEEVAALIAWLASKECSFSTGATFDASGGRLTY
jgi:NAD(P)-dependent dehydrogenase (short-subunit alcohol dehydrogenase family)